MTSLRGSGQGTLRHIPLELPSVVSDLIGDAHSKFMTDREGDGGDGSTWFTLKGVGLLRVAADLSAVEVIGGDSILANANIHGGTVLRHAGETFLALASNDVETVWIADTNGRIARTFSNPYGGNGSPFKVCDVAYVDGSLVASNGYADNVCFTCEPFGSYGPDRSVGTWNAFRFGGEGTDHGRFGTAHGITRVPGTNVLTVADRLNSRLESITADGRYLGGLPLEPGCLPCSIDYHDRLAVVACLKGPGGSTPAPIYIFEDGNLVREINIGRDLGLPGFTHIHNAAFRAIEGTDGKQSLFVLAYAWRPGNLALLQVA